MADYLALCQKLKHKTRNNTWSERDDLELRRLVQMFGHNWPLIGEKLGKKLSRSCRQRWINQLDPAINPWTDEQQWLLYLPVKLYGKHWSEISKIFYRRPDKHIKNYWNTVKMKQKSQKFKAILEHVFLIRCLKQIRNEVTL